jgi:hypothetical protein
MGETMDRLNFTAAGLTGREVAEGMTAYEATAHGVTYRVVGTMVDPVKNNRRTFRAYRVSGASGLTLTPVGPGKPLSTRAAAYAEAEADLDNVLRDRQSTEARLRAKDAEGRCAHPLGMRVRSGNAWIPDECGECGASLPDDDKQPATVADMRAQYEAEHPQAELSDYQRRVIRHVTDFVLQLPGDQQPPPPADPATEDDTNELLDRIVRRAQYTGLKALLGVLDGWVEGCQSNAEALGRRRPDADGVMFVRGDIRRMVNDAARELGTAQPWAADNA